MGADDIWLLVFVLCFVLTAALSVLIIDAVGNIAQKLRIEKALKRIGF